MSRASREQAAHEPEPGGDEPVPYVLTELGEAAARAADQAADYRRAVLAEAQAALERRRGGAREAEAG